MKQKIFLKTRFFDDLLNGVGCAGLTKDSLVMFLESGVKRTGATVLLSTKNPEDAFDFYNRGQEHNDEVFTYFPEKNSGENVPGFEKEDVRYQKESIIKTTMGGGGVVCVGTRSSFKEKTISTEHERRMKKIIFSTGGKLERDGLVSTLKELFYKKTETVEGPNEYLVRGDIVDLFPSHFKNPIRVSFCFNEIESICAFDPTTQLPTQTLNRVVLKEVFASQTVDKTNLINHARGACLVNVCFKKDEALLFFNKKMKLNVFDFLPISSFPGSGFRMGGDHSDLVGSFHVVFYVTNKEGGVPDIIKNKDVGLVEGSIETGFYSKKDGVLVLSENDLLGGYSQTNKWQPKQSKTSLLVSTKSLSLLKRGDLIVHESFGVGFYRGPIEKVFKLGVKSGIEIEYKNNTRVFISMDQLGLVHRYVGSGKKPRISSLGSKKWRGEVKKARESAKDVAFEIFSLYLKNQKIRNFKYVKENDLDNVLSASFSFLETPDQKKAFIDVFADMNRSRPMDRLVSGDVGFGKTEVAIRAIFKAFLSSRVSILLCPTTILADQHFITCKERLSQFGVSVSLLSRFKTKKEQSETIEKLKNNKIDVLIGTHRILSKDVVIKNLGLLIIDEEHRFGVNHKEKIRSFKKGLDVLTLTATPIPRTLQQSLVGLRDLTTIKTPPVSRKPIVTYVKYFNWKLVFNHIQKEINRGGQVYFLNNDVKSIPFIVKKIQHRFGTRVVKGASGKMDNKKLEETILAFFDGNIDVLVCTTIVESGLDITRANTIIINNAQNFGLAQLYQIRGRVGRGHRQASCLLLIPPGKKLKKESFDRLKAIEQNTALGSGHAISQKDLEIRGSGSLFGYKQSGHISTVGFEMYCDLLKKEINLKKNPKKNNEPPVIVIDGKAEIPSSYIKNRRIKIDYYFKISRAINDQEVCVIEQDLTSGFGGLPKETKVLLNMARARVLLTGSIIKRVEASDVLLVLFFKKPGEDFDIVRFFKTVQNFKHKNMLNYKYKNNKNSGLKITFETRGFFPSFDLLFSFLSLIKVFY